MIKNKALNIKFISKKHILKYSKHVKNILGFQTNFCSIKYKRIVFKNSKIVLRPILKNNFKTRPRKLFSIFFFKE